MSGEYEYDFFVIFNKNDRHDRDRAESFLLETEKKFKKKGCYPERDFHPGGYSTDHFESAVKNSAYIFVLLSENGDERFHYDGLTALTQLLKQDKIANRNRIVSISLDDEAVVSNFLQPYGNIKRSDTFFWDRLKICFDTDSQHLAEPQAAASSPQGGFEIDEAIRFTTEKISLGDTKFLARGLGVSETDITDCEDNYPRNAKECKYQILLGWKKTQRGGVRAIFDRLVAALRNARNNEVAEKLLKKFGGGFHAPKSTQSKETAPAVPVEKATKKQDAPRLPSEDVAFGIEHDDDQDTSEQTPGSRDRDEEEPAIDLHNVAVHQHEGNATPSSNHDTRHSGSHSQPESVGVTPEIKTTTQNQTESSAQNTSRDHQHRETTESDQGTQNNASTRQQNTPGDSQPVSTKPNPSKPSTQNASGDHQHQETIGSDQGTQNGASISNQQNTHGDSKESASLSSREGEPGGKTATTDSDKPSKNKSKTKSVRRSPKCHCSIL
ncbi:uncharacterized protein LOC144435781 [Glandiceps talaboti]